MKKSIAMLVFALLNLSAAFGHPGSGIAVDDRGRAVFVDTGAGVWRVERNGALTKLPGPAYHWLALDRTGRLANVQLPSFAENGARTVHVDGVLLASDFPIATDLKGALYYPRLEGNQLRILRLAPNGSTATFATAGPTMQGNLPRWINGSAVGSDGSFYYTEDRGVWKITPHGEVVALYTDAPQIDCVSVPGIDSDVGPHFRGVDVDAKGNVFVAAAACGAVLKIKDKTASVVLRTSSPWSPTAVAVSGGDLYVLEYLHTERHDRREWIPRVRKVTADGVISVIATVARTSQPSPAVLRPLP